MSETIETKGSCLCGAITIQAKAALTHTGACHCSMCRKWGGGPLLAVDCQSAASFTGEEHVSTYNSSEWAERGFCSKCGTHLFYKLKQQEQYIIPVGLLDTDAPIAMDHQIFIDEKPGFYDFANETKNMTGEEVFAMFSGE